MLSTKIIEPIKVIHSGRMVVAPENLDGVFSYELNMGGFDVKGNVFNFENSFSRVFIDTRGARTFESKVNKANGKPLPVIPRDEHFGFGEFINSSWSFHRRLEYHPEISLENISS